MVTPSARPSGECCARRGPNTSGQLLLRALPHGTLVRLRTERTGRRWVVVGVLCHIPAPGQPVSLAYRVQSVSLAQVLTIDVAPEMIEVVATEGDACGGAVPAPNPPAAPGDTAAAPVPAPPAAVVEPALVPEVPAVPETVAEPATAAAQPGDRKSADAAPDHVVTERIAWRQVATGVRCSTDGRFVLEQSAPLGRDWYSATDLWTGDRVERLATASAAEQWCRTRTNAPALDWQVYGSVSVARSADGLAFSVVTGGALSIGSDARFDAASPLRASPLFRCPEAARRWCEARACCVVEPAPKGGTPTLRYRDPIPF